MNLKQLKKAMSLLLWSIDGDIGKRISAEPVEVVEEDEFTARVLFDDDIERDIQFHNTLDLVWVSILAKVEEDFEKE